jgi:hypothetical protein
MARIRGRYWFSIGAVAIGLFWAISAAQSGQQIPGFFGIFGGMINSAIIDSARREWQGRPVSDYNCLTSHGVSADQLASRGIGPDDPRVRQILSQCAFAAPTAPVPVAQQLAEGPVKAAPSPNYVVNGLALGAPFNPQSDPAASYACIASEDFPGFSWCSAHHVESGKFGPNTIWMSVFQSDTNAAVEITEAIEPAFFQRGDVDGEIQRLSRNFDQQARLKTADLPSGGRAVIAIWGAVSLTALDSTTMDALSRGDPVHSGLLVGFLGDLRASAHLGLPVYSLGGGAGFIWNVEYNSSGKGVLRFIAIDPGALKPAAESKPVTALSPTAQSYAASLPSIAAPATPSPAAVSQPVAPPSPAAQSPAGVAAGGRIVTSAEPSDAPATAAARVADEVPQCNDPDVLRLLHDNTIGKEKQWALDFIDSQSPGPGTPAMRAEVQHWDQTIVNIRQQQYDEVNNIRYCVAGETPIIPPVNLGVAIALLSSGMPDSGCARSINYKIERTLDAPDKPYVSWKCH